MVSMVEPGYRGIVTPGWVRDPLWTAARAVPSLDLRFAANRSLRDAVTGRELVTFTRASNAGQINGAGAWETVGNDAARFHHDPVTGQCLGLLVEEQRINLLLNSATLSTQSVTSAATAYTLSFYGTGTITLSGTSTAGPLVGTGANARVSLTFTPTAGTLTLTVSGSVTNANLEAGSFATSWIPTTGTSATRSADIATIPAGVNFSSWYNQSQGTVFADVNTASVANIAQVVFDISEGSGSERIFQRRSTGGFIATATTDNGVIQGDFGSVAVPASGRARSGFSYRLNDFGAAVNGIPSGTDTSATTPTPDRLHIGQNFASGQLLNGTISRLTYWPSRLPDSTLQALTT
jgi:hypothetical protein